MTINELSRLWTWPGAWITATTVYNTFDPDPAPGDRRGTRDELGVGEATALLLQPTCALPRKNVEGALALAEAVDGTYWLLGLAEDGYGPELERLLAGARCPVVRGGARGRLQHRRRVRGVRRRTAALHLGGLRQPVGRVGHVPAARSPSARIRWRPSWPLFGFRWFDAADPAPLGAFLSRPTAPPSSTTTRWRPSTSTGPTCRGGWPGCSSGSPASDPIGR